MGTLSVILRVKRVWVETSRGRTEEAAGTISTSSKVSPSLVNFSSRAFGLYSTDMSAVSSFKKTPSPRFRARWTAVKVLVVSGVAPAHWRYILLRDFRLTL